MIDRRRCRYIRTIAECRSFSRAAQVLYVSQPSLSRLVKRLEQELGVALFDRSSFPLELTTAGRKYLDYIDRFEALEARMHSEFLAMCPGVKNRLSIATLPFLGTYVLPKVVPRFADLYPGVDLDIQECSSSQLLEQLSHNRADLALTNLLPDLEQFSYCQFCSDHIMLAAPYNEKMQRLFPRASTHPDHPVEADLALLLEETLIVLRPWQNMRIAADAICRHFAFYPRQVIEAPSLASALSLVGSNRGITFVCQSSVSCIQPETPLIYFSLGEMSGLTSILAVFRKNSANPIIRDFCECASCSLLTAPRL